MKKQPPFFRPASYAIPVIVLLLLSVIFKSCSKNNSSAPAPVNSVQLANDPVLGSYLTDNKGFTLYFFADDADGISTCKGGCLTVWPVFYDSLLSAATLGTGLTATDFAVITNSTGAKQTTYKGWPLYHFAPNGSREAAGQKGGEKVGNTWFVLKPNYSLMLANKKVVASGTTDSTMKEFLIDSAGNTLYYFGKDSLSPATLPINCIGGCIATWPVFYTPNNVMPSSLAQSDFGTITRSDGPGGANRLQSTYRGRPLYYFAPDSSRRGSAKGEGVGKIWYVMNPDITKIN